MAEQASGSTRQSQHDAVLQQRVAALEQERAEFVKRKQQLESEFNQKRAKFKELYLSKEEELKCQAASLEGAHSELSRVQAQLEQAQADMENIKAVATVSESTKQEAIDQVKGQWQEEVASLQAIMKDTVREYEVQFHQRLEQERAQWNQYREVVEREMGELRHRLSEGGQEEENLENDMKKAQEDAEKLRSVVMPMEQEIAALKVKLTVAEDRVKELEASKVSQKGEGAQSCPGSREILPYRPGDVRGGAQHSEVSPSGGRRETTKRAPRSVSPLGAGAAAAQPAEAHLAAGQRPVPGVPEAADEGHAEDRERALF
eukprot:XP_014052631.1 PREDICTED: rab GTPase-binding effector protein 1-like isoform X5 [Salmo salar]